MTTRLTPKEYAATTRYTRNWISIKEQLKGSPTSRHRHIQRMVGKRDETESIVGLLHALRVSCLISVYFQHTPRAYQKYTRVANHPGWKLMSKTTPQEYNMILMFIKAGKQIREDWFQKVYIFDKADQAFGLYRHQLWLQKEGELRVLKEHKEKWNNWWEQFLRM